MTGTLPAVPIVPPKRPTRLPARYATGLGIHGQPTGSGIGASVGRGAVGGGVGTGVGEQKPNRYAWAQMQHWQQAAAAASKQQATGNHPHPDHPHHQGFQHHFSSPFSSAASRVLVVNPMQIVNLSEHTKSSLIKFIEAIKRFSEKWFSHVLLLLFLAVYACLGAYIFISFEASQESSEKQQIIDTRLSLVNGSWHEARARDYDQFLELFRTRLEDYERMLNKACAVGMTSSSLENQWTFWGALFYSMTVFTTIGYGHLTPITFAGRVATMIYAIFGIPILLMVLADLGKLLTRIIKYAFKKFRYLFSKLLKRKSSLKTRKMISDNTNQYIGVAKDALERGFAYMQHQPAALRVNNLKQKLFVRKQKASPPQQQPEADSASPGRHLDEALSADPIAVMELGPNPDADADANMNETTDVIVTPARQTKPVSPPIGAKKSMADTVMQASGNHHHQHHHHHLHHHQRSQSPAFRIKRKVSTSGLMGSRRHNQMVKNSLSKSSSSTVVTHQQTDKQTNSKKNSDAGQHAATSVEQTNSNIEATPAQDKLKSEPPSNSDIDVTTDETIDVVAEFELEDDEEGSDEDEPEDEFDIPVSFALFLLVTYMMLGAVVFSIWEGWNFFDSLYFVFISMSTIGFGDLVPQHPKRMIGTFIYLLFGLALTSMCINVVQEKIHATFLRAKMQIGEKMGFDLDQIMADDYYDGSLVYDVEATETIADESNNSATSPQTIDHHHQHQATDETAQLILNANRPITSQSLDGTQPHVHDQTLKQSKSKESLRAKKRSVSGLLGHQSGVSLATSNGSFMKRRPSKKVSRQGTPMSTNIAIAAELPVEHVPSSNNAKPAELEVQASADAVPLRSHLEVRRTEYNHQPSINAPIDSVKSTCEPLRGEFWARSGERPKLVSSRSLQPNSSTSFHAEPGRRSPPGSPYPLTTTSSSHHRQTNRAGSESVNRMYEYRPPIKSTSYQGRSDLEAALSRRSSVSHELNQLDDLIVALGRSPFDKSGPLLGIPSSARPSRSNSPSIHNQAASFNNINYRRGTSMTSRPSSTRPMLQVTKKTSSVSGGSCHETPSPRNLSLNESQAALDKLDAVKSRT